MRSYEFCYEVTVDPEDVLDSLSIPQIKEYLICRKTINLNDKDTAVDLELSKWERDAILKVLVQDYCPANLETDRESIKDAFKRMMEDYLEY